MRSPERPRRLAAAGLGLATAFQMSVMSLSAKVASLHGGSPLLVVGVRGCIGFSLAILRLLAARAPLADYVGPALLWPRLLLLCRVVIGTVALTIFMFGVVLMPLGDCVALFLTNQTRFSSAAT